MMLMLSIAVSFWGRYHESVPARLHGSVTMALVSVIQPKHCYSVHCTVHVHLILHLQGVLGYGVRQKHS